VCIALCTTVVHNIAQNRPDNFPSYPPAINMTEWHVMHLINAIIKETSYTG